MKRVGVIGAGAAGLCAARHLAARPDYFTFKVFEQTGDIGGTWCYQDNVGTNEFGLPVHSSMYKNMRTNLPKEIMGFLDFPFPGNEGASFIHHSKVLEYLQKYAKHFDLIKYIQFYSHVFEMKPVTVDRNRLHWEVKVKNLLSRESTQHIFDAIIVCNGRYACPSFPDIKGLESFPGWVLHSHDYRSNIPFKGKRVVVLGAGPSGIDISVELAEVAEQVILSHNLNKKFLEKYSHNVSEEVGISEVIQSTVKFLNGHEFETDVLVLCTGYNYDISFLHPDCKLFVQDQRMQPLYKHLIHIEFPTLAIFGVLKTILPFPIYHQQMLFFLRVLDGSVMLPSENEMREDEKADFNHRIQMGMPFRYAHKMSKDLQWNYDDVISKIGRFSPISKVVRDLYNHIHHVRQKNPIDYKDHCYRIVNSCTFLKLED